MLVQDRDTQCQTDEAMTIYVRLACMAGMVMQQRNSIELLAEFRYRRIIDTEKDRFILLGRRNQAASQFRCLQAERTARHRFVLKRPVITI